MSHRFSLRQLEYAVAVADTLNFRKAAERCNVSQPSLSAPAPHGTIVLAWRKSSPLRAALRKISATLRSAAAL